MEADNSIGSVISFSEQFLKIWLELKKEESHRFTKRISKYPLVTTGEGCISALTRIHKLNHLNSVELGEKTPLAPQVILRKRSLSTSSGWALKERLLTLGAGCTLHVGPHRCHAFMGAWTQLPSLVSSLPPSHRHTLTSTHTRTQSQSTVHRDLQAYRLCDSRSTLHSDGADVVHAAVIDVAALGGELHTLALEVLLLKQSHLHTERGRQDGGGGH